jgi:hypothetical protein
MGSGSDSFHQVSSPPIKNEAKQSRLQLGMVGVDGYKQPAGELGWTDEWSNFTASQASAQQPRPIEATPSCCQPQTIPEEPVEMAPPPSCCAPKATAAFGLSEEARHGSHQPVSQQMRQMSGNEHQGFENTPFNDAMNFGMTFADPFTTFGAPSFASVPTGLDFFGELEGREGCGSHIYMPEQLDGSSDGHNCHCGEKCDCLGCATHPANRTTTEYVRYHNDLASRGYYLPSRVQAPLSMIQRQPPYTIPSTSGQYAHPDLTATHNTQHGQVGPRFNQAYSHAPAYVPSANDISSWQMGSQIPALTPTNELQQFHIHTPNQIPSTIPPTNQFHYHNEFHSPPGQPFQVSEQKRQPTNTTGKAVSRESVMFELPQRKIRDVEAVFDHDSPSTDDDTSTLSPSSFHIQQFNMPGCNDMTGTCQCGDGCQCPGCLTHSGHGEDRDNEVSSEGGQLTDQGSAQAGRAQDLNGFSVNTFHREAVVPTTVPG